MFKRLTTNETGEIEQQNNSGPIVVSKINITLSKGTLGTP
jgi:hypothetical protein